MNTYAPMTMMKPIEPPRLLSRLGGALAVLLAGTVPMTARTNAPVADAAIELSPFEVNASRDSGYTAVGTLAGGRTETQLKYTSAAVSVMTAQFLEDIGATNFREADEWAVNFTPAPEVNTNGFGGHSVNYRNMGSTFSSRNYFLWYIEGDVYNTERIEQARGPNGVLFGDGGAAGVGNTWTKRPRLDRDAYTLRAEYGSHGFMRGTADLNQKLGDRAALRLSLLQQDGQKEWRDHTFWDRRGAHLAGLVRLTDRNNVRFEAEIGDWTKSIYANYINDQASLWDGRTTYSGTGTIASPGNFGLQLIPAAETNIYVTGMPDRGIMNWTGFYRSTGVANSVNLLPTGAPRTELKGAPSLPRRSFNYTPTDIVGTADYHAYTFYVDHRFSPNLFVELAFNRQRNVREANGNPGNNFGIYNLYRIDTNAVLPGGAANPNLGKAYNDSQVGRTMNANMVDDVRLMANWRHGNNWLRESISFITGARTDRFQSANHMLRRTDTNQNIWVRHYWDQAGQSIGELNLPGTAYVQTSGNNQRKAITYAQIATTTQLFGDRLTLALGGRYDRFQDHQVNFNGNRAKVRTDPLSKHAGAVYYFIPSLGVFANYSETFQPPNSGNPLLDGSAAGISRGEGKDFGFKIDLLEGRVSGSIAYYETEQQGRLQGGNNVTEVNSIWNAMGQPQNAIQAFRDTNDLSGKGWEVEITANLSRNLRLMLNYARPEVVQDNVEQHLKAYVATHLPAWQSAAATDPAIATTVTTITQRLENLTEGAILNNTARYTANVYATYSFRDGPLKNLEIGGGANIRGGQKVGNRPGNAFDYLYNNEYVLVRMHASYRYRINSRVMSRFQLGIDNLLDDDTLIAGGYANITNAASLAPGADPLVPSSVRIENPRRVTLSATFEF